MKVLCILLSIVVAVNADYHTEIGIPLAARVKAYEDRIFAGTQEMKSRIVGGEIAPVFAHPYMVGLILRLKTKYLSLCGSSLVTDIRLVTAAHCVTNTASLKAVLDTPFVFHGGTRVITKEFVAHPQFNQSVSMDYDIAVVKLPRPVDISETLHPIRLPSSADEAEVVGEWAVTAGWGLQKDADRNKQWEEYLILNQVRVQIIPETVCITEYHSYKIRGNAVCTSSSGGVGPCDGDSGGPLIVERNRRKILVERNRRKILVGVVSHGYYYCESSYPFVYTRVLPYKDFILQA